MFRYVVIMSAIALFLFWFGLLSPMAEPVRALFGAGIINLIREYAPDITLMFLQVILVSGIISGLLAWNLDQQWERVRDVMLKSVEGTLKRGHRAMLQLNHDLTQLCDETDHAFEHDHPDDHHDHDMEHHTDDNLGKIESSIAKRKLHFDDLHDDMYMMLGALQSSLNPKVAVVFANSTEAFRQIVNIAKIVEVASQRTSKEDHGRSAKAVERRLKMAREHIDKMRSNVQSAKTHQTMYKRLWLPILEEVEETIKLLHRFS